MPPLFQFLTLLALKIFICEQVSRRPLIPLKASHFGIRQIAAARSSFSPVFVIWFLDCFFPYILQVVLMNLYTQNLLIVKPAFRYHVSCFFSPNNSKPLESDN